jgi:iron-sulfur cluster assembly protein
MQITDQAKQVLVDILKEQGAEGLRLSSVAGCCGPQIAISMDEPEPSDNIQTINGIRVAIDPDMTATQELTIDLEKTPEGEGLVLIGAGNCC